MMNRMDCLKILAKHVTDEIVVATYSSATDWMAINDRPLNYFAFGAMGLASSHGLGLALARPEKRVIVLDGDGSLLMNLGTLVTIGAVQPKNFVHFVGHNGSYEANGGAPLPNRDVDFAAMARAAGIASCHTFTELSDFEAKVGDVIKAEGPVFADLLIEQGPLSNRDYSEMHSAARREAFREALDAGM
ncbi:MAG: thiamine pyrophosphate-dependent enzyme [Alphaproteobacteria bacterium]|nr:thiamine pyrophosphate-dependent enzyme [Alphaproteobacteria bacterium]